MDEIKNENTKKIIKDWFKKGQKEVDYFDKFIYLWISFNAFYCGITLDENGKKENYKKWLCDKEKNDGDGKRMLFCSDINQKLFEKLVEKEEYKEYYEFILKREHPNHPNKKKGGIVRLDNNRLVKYKNIEKLKEFILIIYQVRSNLFHGGKGTSSENSRELIEKTNIIFETFLKKLYEKETII